MSTPATLGHFDVTFLADNAVSRNKRVYLPEAVESAVHAAQADLDRGVPLTVFATHAAGLADDASQMAGRIARVWREGEKAKARLEMFATDAGRNIAAVVKAGGLKTVSLRSNDFEAAPHRVERDGEKLEAIRRLRLAGIDCTLAPGLSVAHIDAVALEAQHGGAPRLLELMEADVGALTEAVMKSEADGKHPKADYAYTPDDEPSHWKLRIDTARNVAGAAAAFSKGGFRGRKVQIPSGDVAKVKAKVRTAWRRFFPDKSDAEMPDSIQEALDADWCFLVEAFVGDDIQTHADDVAGYATPDPQPMTPNDWVPCGFCRAGNESGCTCPGCRAGDACWCCAVAAGDGPLGDTTQEEAEESVMKEEDVKRLIAEALAAAQPNEATITEARHNHAHDHAGMDGTAYTHEHEHGHSGQATHEAPEAHMHGHVGSLYGMESLIHADPQQLVEALSRVITEQKPALTEAGRAISAATKGRLVGMITTLESVIDDLQGLAGLPDDAAAGDADDTSESTPQQTQLTEALEKNTALAGQNVTLTEQVADLVAKLTEAQTEAAKQAALATQAAELLTTKWRDRRQVPIEALKQIAEGAEGDREVAPREALEMYGRALAERAGIASR